MLVPLALLASTLLTNAPLSCTVCSNTIPFEFREDMIWIKAESEVGHTPLNLILDTGAQVSVIAEGTAKNLRLKMGRPRQVRGVHCSMTGRWPVAFAPTASGVTLFTNCLALDLSTFNSAFSTRVDGLIGADFLKGRIVQIDFQTRLIRLLDPRDSPPGSNSIRMRMNAAAYSVPLRVNGGETQWMRLDTGCASPVEWVTRRFEPVDGAHPTAIGLAKLAVPRTRTSVQIGPHAFPETITGLHKKPIFPGESGLAGMGLLSQFKRVTIDAIRMQLDLEY